MAMAGRAWSLLMCWRKSGSPTRETVTGTATTAPLTPWQQLATNYGVAVTLLQHDRRARAADLVDALSGTHGVAGSADSVLRLARDRMENYGNPLTDGRDVAEYGPP
jgi:hypothetical protein